MSNFLEGVQRATKKVESTIRNTKIDVDYNPFDDGKVGASVGGTRIEQTVIPIDGKIQTSIQRGKNRVSAGVSIDPLEGELGIFSEASEVWGKSTGKCFW